jgi:hypothetical protein
MKPLTYGELLAALYELSPEQLAMSATVCIGDECLPVTDTYLSDTLPDSIRDTVEDALGDNHPVMMVG